MTGSEKLPLIVIRRHANPRCFKVASLLASVVYKSNQKAWMTAQLFEEYEEYMHQLDCHSAIQQRNVLNVLDNASAHVVLDNLAAIRLFLPPNMTVLGQLLDQGIIRSVQQLYRKNLLHRMSLAIDSSKAYAIDLLGTMHLHAHFWMQVLTATVQSCFA